MMQTKPIQVLSQTGAFDTSEVPDQYRPYLDRIDENFLTETFRQMVQVRAYDAESTALQRQGKLALWVPVRGQEAIQIGIAHALKTQDMVFPSYREHAIAHVRGLDLVDINRIFRGYINGGWNPKDHNFHIYTLVIGTQALHATGYGMGINFDGLTGTGDNTKDTAVLACYGDGASSQGDASEALVFAASYQTPTVFLVQNNNWAISVPVTVQSRIPLYQRAHGFGIPSVQVDGNDIIASHIVGAYWLDQARAGNGPAYIEAKTFRLGAHTSSDDPTKYQDPALLASWQERDPLDRLRLHLKNHGAEDSFFQSVDEEAKDFASDIRRRTLALQPGPAGELFEAVYAEDHPLIDEQRRWFEAYESQYFETNTAEEA